MIGKAPIGVLSEDLRAACLAALDIPRQDCVAFAADYTWEVSTQAFIGQMAVPQGSGMDDMVEETVAEPPRGVAALELACGAEAAIQRRYDRPIAKSCRHGS